MFPPFSLVGYVLAKIHRDKTNPVIVTPDRSTQYWYPLYFRPSPRNLTFPQKPYVNPSLCTKPPVNSNQGNNTTEKNLEASLMTISYEYGYLHIANIIIILNNEHLILKI